MKEATNLAIGQQKHLHAKHTGPSQHRNGCLRHGLGLQLNCVGHGSWGQHSVADIVPERRQAMYWSAEVKPYYSSRTLTLLVAHLYPESGIRKENVILAVLQNLLMSRLYYGETADHAVSAARHHDSQLLGTNATG